MKTLIVCMFCACALSAFAAIPMKASQRVIDGWKKDFASEKIGKRSKTMIEVNLKIIEGQVVINNFNDLKVFVIETGKKYGVDDVEGVLVSVASGRFADNQNICNEEFYDICKKIKKSVAYNAANRLPDEVKLGKYIELFSTNVSVRYCNSRAFAKAVDECIRLCNKQEEAKAKAVLKMMNRAFSPFLVANKVGWEPIVAKVRTTLEAY